ncbi:flagellar hook capping FlgD N-terminal domain-containing protein [Clostridium merdae]|uniref:flagellar hook capping FlgD N-terminal domain-containing protein n=1 Tax=Clostridium merdae TaxID=1958780 RepID=UPI000A2695B5|nr:flagellar hook capping FlgD N-terminal domain-containing protein [Clostridium merdae]
MDVGQINAYSNTAKKSSAKSAASLSIDQFLNLLAAQLSNQDVLNPTQDTEFVAQMAQFTSLQALENLNQYASYQYGSSLIGKRVSVAKYDSTGKYISDIGIVSQADYSSGDTTVTVNGRSYALTNIMEVVNDASYQSYQYAASLVGKKVEVSGYDNEGKVVQSTGLVTSCSFASGDAMVVVDGKKYTLSAVRQVISETAGTDTNTSEPGTDSSSDSNTDGDKTPASE